MDFADDARTHTLVDWDHDGDVDIWSANRTAPQVRFLQNSSPPMNDFVALRLRGTECNRDAIGATVAIQLTGQSKPIVRQLYAGSGYLGQSSKTLTIGLGANAVIDSLSVRWPGAHKAEHFKNAVPGARLLLVQGTQQAQHQTRRETINLAAGDLELASPSDTANLLVTSQVLVPPIPYRSMEGSMETVYPATAADSSGQPVPDATLVAVWASWCTPCIEELHRLDESFASLRAHEIDVVALSVDEIDEQSPGKPAVAQIARQLSGQFRIGLATKQTLNCLQTLYDMPFRQFRQISIPSSILIGSDGRMLAMYRGAVATKRVLRDVQKRHLPYEQLVGAALPFPGRWHRIPQRPSMLTVPVLLMEEAEVDLVWEMVQQHHAIFKDDDEFAKLLVWIGDERFKNGRAAEALRVYEEAMQIDPTNMLVANNIAWQFAANKNHASRDGEKAVKWATVAAKSSNYQNEYVLDTLAAAYAQNRQFDKAVEAAKKAIAIAIAQGDTKKQEDFASRLRRYQKKQNLP